MKAKRGSRIWEIDFLRGFAIILVVFDHACFALYQVFTHWQNCGVTFLEKLNELGAQYIEGDLRFFWRPAFLFLFFCVSGTSSAFSKNNFMRAVKLGIVAIILSVVTYFGEKISGGPMFILFGVLHCFALIILIYAIIEKVIKLSVNAACKEKDEAQVKKIERIVLTVVSLVLSIAFFVINHYFNVTQYQAFGRPTQVVETNNPIYGLFFYTENWWTADYFPLFPYIAIFFLGAGLAGILYPKRRSLLPILDSVWHKPITFCGRYSIFIYILGTVAVFILLGLISLVALGRIL